MGVWLQRAIKNGAEGPVKISWHRTNTNATGIFDKPYYHRQADFIASEGFYGGKKGTGAGI